MRRGILFIFALPVMLAGFVMAAPAALAVSPHFVSASATVNADGSLTVARRARRAPSGAGELHQRKHHRHNQRHPSADPGHLRRVSAPRCSRGVQL